MRLRVGQNGKRLRYDKSGQLNTDLLFYMLFWTLDTFPNTKQDAINSGTQM